MCIRDRNWTVNSTNWATDTHTFGYGYFKLRVTRGKRPDLNPGDYHLGNLTIQCNSTKCCATNLSFIPLYPHTYVSNATAFVGVHGQNGTFICGKLLVINKTVKDPSTGNWIDGPLTLGPGWKGKDLIFKITVTAPCENLSNVVVNDTMGPRLSLIHISEPTRPY